MRGGSFAGAATETPRTPVFSMARATSPDALVSSTEDWKSCVRPSVLVETRGNPIRSSSGLRLCASASGTGRHRTDGEAISGVVMHELQAIGEGWRRVIFGQKSEGLSPAAPVVASSAGVDVQV
jgi:hypothetical protein